MEEILLPDGPSHIAPVLYNPHATFCFLIPETPRDFSEDERLMFEKIVIAMGQTLQDVALIFSKDDAGCVKGRMCRVLVVFEPDTGSKQIGQWRSGAEDPRIFTTHGLSSMLQNPGLKKQTWQHLQQVMAFLKGQ